MSSVSYSHFQKSRSAIVIIFLLLMLCKLLMCATWPSSSSSQTNVYIEKYTFPGYDTTSYGVVQGTKDYATFYLDYVFNATISAKYGVIRRVNADNSAVWMTALNLIPAMKTVYL